MSSSLLATFIYEYYKYPHRRSLISGPWMVLLLWWWPGSVLGAGDTRDIPTPQELSWVEETGREKH